MTKKETKLYNAYRKLMDSTTVRVNNKIDDALKKFAIEIKTSSKPFATVYDKFVDSSGLREDLATTVRASFIQQTAIGYNVLPTVNVNVIEAIASPGKLVEIYGKTKGVKLSKGIYKTIDTTQKDILSTLKQAHSDKLVFNKTVLKMEKQLDKVVIKQDQLAKYMRDVEKKGRLLIDIENTETLKAFRKSVANAKSQIELLTDNKPFKTQQKSSLNSILKAVEKNSVEKLDTAIEKAVTAKYKSNMRRLVVTENGTVYEQAMYNERCDNPIVTAVKFTLSSSHKVIDECNILAETDFYGIGSGNYPIKNQPQLVIHPNGVSFMQSLTFRQVSEAQINSAKKVTNNTIAKAGTKAKLSPSQIKSLKNLETQKRTSINSKIAIESVTK